MSCQGSTEMKDKQANRWARDARMHLNAIAQATASGVLFTMVGWPILLPEGCVVKGDPPHNVHWMY